MTLKEFLAAAGLSGKRDLFHDSKGEVFFAAEPKGILESLAEISSAEYLDLCRENGMEPEESPEALADLTLSAEDRATKKTAWAAKLAGEGKTPKVMQKDRIITFRASDESVDRAGDIIRVDGWDFSDYKKNPVFLNGHNYDKAPLGRTIKVWKENADGSAATGKSLMIRVYFPPKEVSAESDAALRGILGGLYGAVSVGFKPVKVRENVTDEERAALGLGKYGVEFLKQKLWEVSLVTVPANQNALVVNSAEHAEICKSLGVPFTKADETPAPAPDPSPTPDPVPVSATELAAFRADMAAMRAEFKAFSTEVKTFRESLEAIEEACMELIKRSNKPASEDGGPGASQKGPEAGEAEGAFKTLMESINGMKIPAAT